MENQVKIPKLTPGKMNVPYIVCKPGYAEGVAKPKRAVVAKPFNPAFIVRKNGKVA